MSLKLAESLLYAIWPGIPTPNEKLLQFPLFLVGFRGGKPVDKGPNTDGDRKG